LGHLRAEWILLPRRAAAFWEGTNAVEGGTGKAEDGKLPGAGIIPKPCPRKGAAEMETIVESRGCCGATTE